MDDKNKRNIELAKDELSATGANPDIPEMSVEVQEYHRHHLRSVNIICPVCGKHTFTVEYELCPVCMWQQDSIQEDDSVFSGGANALCLNDFKMAWLIKLSSDFQIDPVLNTTALNELLGRSV